jgi:hypothetical protein
MNPVKLSEIIPEKSEIQLYVNGELRQFELRAINLEDKAWIQNNWGDAKAIEEVFKKFELDKISKLLFRLVSPKEPFKLSIEKVYDDDGREVEIERKSYQKIQQGIRGEKHMVEVLQALMKCFGVSNPLVEEDKSNTKKK